MNQHHNIQKRKINPRDIALPPGYITEIFATDLTTPINIIFTDTNDILIADSGITSGNGKVLKYNGKSFDVIAQNFNPPLTGITYYNNDIFVSHRGYVTTVKPDGTKVNILEGLPSFGDHHNNKVEFGPDGKMYYGQGTATNSGVVGIDNEDWVRKYPFFHDYPGSDIYLSGNNYASQNFLTESINDIAYTGAYSPFGVPTALNEHIKGLVKAGGSIMRANPDGSELELVAWGLRNPFRLKFDKSNYLFSTNHGMDVRGSRPVANSPDEFLLISPGVWYGWPDFTGGYPVTLPYFKPDDEPQPDFLLADHTVNVPKPFSTFIAHSAIMGFDFNFNNKFGNPGDAYIAEFGSEAPETTGGKPLPGVGHRISNIDMKTGDVNTFAINKSGFAASYTGEGGFERPIDVIFGTDDEMFIADFGISEDDGFIPGTGVIWKIKHI